MFNYVSGPPPFYRAFPGLENVDARFYTARLDKDCLGLDCSLGESSPPTGNLENRARIAKSFGVAAAALLTTRQSSNAAHMVEEGWEVAGRPAASALVTCRNDFVLGVLSSDCAPVMFAEPTSGVVAAAHIGWRDVAHDLLPITLAQLEHNGADRANIHVAIGPCVGVDDTYIVDQGFPHQHPNNDPAIREHMRDLSMEKAVFYFQNYIFDHVLTLGVSPDKVSRLAIDTCATPDFFSRRRNGPGNGMMLSAIKLVKPRLG